MGLRGFVRIDGIEGASREDGRRGSIDLLSFSHGIYRSSPDERCQHGEVSLVKYSDAASPLIALACCQGRRFAEARVDLVGDDRAGLSMKLSDVAIISYRPGGSLSGPDQRPIEEFSLQYGTIEWIWSEPYGKDGLSKPMEVRTSWTREDELTRR